MHESLASASVREFHRLFQVPVLDKPALVPSERRELRLSLVSEEVEELHVAARAGDLVEIADALADILYVAYGMALEYGIPVDEVFAEVHRSNMTKVWDDGTIHRREDGKILKPPTYSKADAASVLTQELL